MRRGAHWWALGEIAVDVATVLWATAAIAYVVAMAGRALGVW